MHVIDAVVGDRAGESRCECAVVRAGPELGVDVTVYTTGFLSAWIGTLATSNRLIDMEKNRFRGICGRRLGGC